jgi:hypothetical protein
MSIVACITKQTLSVHMGELTYGRPVPCPPQLNSGVSQLKPFALKIAV